MTRFFRLSRVLSVAMMMAMVVSGSVVVTNSVTAQDGTPEAAVDACAPLMGIGSPEDSCITVVHAVADAPGVDIYLNGQLAIENLQFAETSGYTAIPAGTYSIDVVPTAGALEDSVLNVPSLAVETGMAYEVAAVGTLDSIQPQVYPVDLSPLPPGPEGTPLQNTRVRVVHAVPDAPAVNITIIAGDIAQRPITDLAFPDASDYITERAGTYRIRVELADFPVGSLDLSSVTFEGESVYTVYALGSIGDGELQSLPIVINLDTGEFTGRESASQDSAPVAEAGLVASVRLGTCTEFADEPAWELKGDGYDKAGAGAIVPWSGSSESVGDPEAIPVLYGEGVMLEANFDQLLDRAVYALVVTDTATGETVACGGIGGQVEKGKHLWGHDQIKFGIEAVDGSGISGVATLTEDRGILVDRVHLSIELLDQSENG